MTTIGPLIGIVAAFVIVNAVFVAAEFALVCAPRQAIEHRAETGDRLSRRLLDVLLSPLGQDRYIATSQLGVTIASLGLGMYGEHRLAQWIEVHEHAVGVIRDAAAHGIATVVALALLTFVHIVAGEMLPKSIALQHTERAARLLYWPMRVMLLVTYPLVAALSFVGRLLLALAGIRRSPNAHDQSYTAEELQLLVKESEQGGAIRAESGRLLRELFEFGDLTASQVMVPRVRVIGIPVGATPADVRAILLTHRHTRYPAYVRDLDHIIGMLHAKDLLRRLIANEPVTRADVRPMPIVPMTSPLDDVLAEMQRSHTHMAVVIDEHGGTAGVVSIEDLSDEVVGDTGESGTGSSGADGRVREDQVRDFSEAEGVVRVAGTVRLSELGERFGVDLEHSEVDSVSGLVLERLGRPPVVGDVVEYGRLRLEVTSVSGRGVQEVRASLVAQPDTEAE